MIKNQNSRLPVGSKPRLGALFKPVIDTLSALQPISLLLMSVFVSMGLTLPIVAGMSLYFHGEVMYDYLVTGIVASILVSFALISIMTILFREMSQRKSVMQLSEARLSEAQRVAHLGSFEWNIVTGELQWSDEHFRIWGFEPGSVTPSYELFLQRVHPDDLELVKNTLDLALQDSKLYECFHRVCCPDGTERYIHGRAELLVDHGIRPLRMIGTVQDITQLKNAEAHIHSLAFYDTLTSLPNRSLLLETIQKAMAVSDQSGQHCALIFLDLDNFKTLNDTKGHGIGDFLLVEVAKRLQACARDGDTVARSGGDEFVVIIESLSRTLNKSAMQAQLVAEKIHAELSQPYELVNLVYHATVSIGIHMFRGYQESLNDLFKHADIAMYQAKIAGRDTIRFFDSAVQDVLEIRVALETDLRDALPQRQFELYYQMQVDDGHRIIGAEALLRWKHPVRGLVSPAQFIPLAEETGFIVPIGLWVLETACTQIKAWEHGPLTRDLLLSINASARQFRQPDFVNQVQMVLAKTGANPKLLGIELTESLVLDNVADTIDKMQALKKIGVKFSMDDFGTGQSSLTYLKRLPLDQLKIDQSFIRDITIDSSDAIIVQTIIGMAKTLGLGIIAEGVETGAQRNFLQHNGCSAYQGYLFSKPVPLQEFERLLKQSDFVHD